MFMLLVLLDYKNFDHKILTLQSFVASFSFSYLYMCVAGGDSKTLMFVQISPSDQDLGETLSSLNFASRVRGIELGPVRKQVDTSELQKVKAMVGLVSSDIFFFLF
jgi:hypothetical protein